MRCSSWTKRTRSAARFAAALAAALAAAVALAGALHAQSPVQTAALTALRDSLQRITTPDALGQVAPAWATPVSRAMAQLRDAFTTLRRGELAHSVAGITTAASRFDEATHSAPDWAYPWFGRGLAKLSLIAENAIARPIAGQRLGEDNYTAFTRDAAQALQRDSTFPPLVRFLAATLAAQGDRAQPAIFIHALDAASREAGADPRATLVVGRANRTARNYHGAIAAFDRYLAAGGDSGVGLLERARALAGLDRRGDAATAYLAGADRAGSEGRQLYREDLEWIATPGELARFDSTSAEASGRWIGAFWAKRDAAEARAPGERLQEHLRRWAYVYSHFRVFHPERRTQFERVRVLDIGPCSDAREKTLGDYALLRPDRPDDYRRRERVLDDRAPIYMRHGEPWEKRAPTISAFSDGADAGSATLSADAPPPLFVSEDAERERIGNIRGSGAWLYWIDGAPRVFFFSSSGALGTGPTTLYAIPPLNPDLLWELASLDPSFRRAASRLQTRAMIASRANPSARCDMSVQDLIVHTRADVQAGVTHDSYTMLFRKPLDALVQTFAVGHAAESAGRILVSFALEGGKLHPAPRTDGRPGVGYTVTLRVGAVDSATGIARTMDTTRTFYRPDSLRTGQYLTALAELPVPAGRYAVRVAVFEPSGEAGMSVQRNVATLTTGSPALSDIVMATDADGVRWNNGGDPLLVNALGAYPEKSTALTYYEMSGLVPGRTYQTTIALRKYAKGKAEKNAGVSLVFTDIADAPVVHVRRSVNLASLRHGQYQITVTVRDLAAGREVSRDQLLNITAR